MRNFMFFRKKMMAVLLSVTVGAGGFAGTVDAAQMKVLQDGQGIRRTGDTQSTGIHVETPSIEEIKVRAAAVERINPVYAEVPVTTAPYSPGALSDATLQNAVDTVNLVRFIAGVPSDVTLKAEYSELAQAASLVNFVNDTISHTPVKPDDMDDSLYQLGKSGAGSSNLGCGWGSGSFYANGRPFYDAVIHGWMYDGSASNISRVGHRRWVINPSMKQTGFGMVWGKQGNRNSFQDAMYAFDNAFGKTDYYGVAWPAQNMPVEFFGKDYPWSISMGTEVADDVVVTLTRRSDGKLWSFQAGSTDFYIENSNYGKPGCIIFRPSGVGEYQAGDSFDVSIAGTGLNVKYTVNFFSLDADASETPAATPTLAPTAEPTATPAVTPTLEPTATPAMTPTTEPTATPAVTPTLEPTATPAVTPTLEPTVTPTLEPTVIPTVTPNATPNVSPVTSATPGDNSDETSKVPSVTKPKRVTVKSAKNKSGKKIVVSWKKVSGVAGYQLEYALNKSFTSSKKRKTTAKTSITLKKLKKKKTYYVRVRAYKKDSKGKVYGDWSGIKKVKIKK